jgi:hypothetical protein
LQESSRRSRASSSWLESAGYYHRKDQSLLSWLKDSIVLLREQAIPNLTHSYGVETHPWNQH